MRPKAVLLLVSLYSYLEVAAEMAAQEVADHPAHREVERAEAVEAHLHAVHVLHLKVCQ